MDKNEVMELIDIASESLISATGEYPEDDTKVRLAIGCLDGIKRELSMPNWIPVEIDLPPYEEAVLVTSTEDTGEIYFSHRTNRKDVITDPHQFATYKDAKPITHWQRVDGLPCGSASRDE